MRSWQSCRPRLADSFLRIAPESTMDARTRDFVRRRAGERCEYCHMPEAAHRLSFHVEHIVASVHRIDDSTDNLAWACPRCNAHKGTNLSTIDPQGGGQVNLFNPRVDRWSDHLAIKDSIVIGLSAVGRATIQLLQMNAPQRIDLRREYMDL